MPPVFISHSSRDNAAASALKARLAEAGHRSVFLDFDPEQGIPAGREWERELYERIRACQAMVVLCSQASMASRWCFMEITHARALGKPLFAMKIEDCSVEGVLADLQVIDVAEGEGQAFARLMRGMAAAGVDAAQSFPWDGTRSPYPGMLTFEEEDAAVFFGRTAEIARGLELLNRIRRTGEPRTLMVLGASGTGKSSLVRAGIVPRLRRNPDRWLIVDTIRPRVEPLRELATAIHRAAQSLGSSRPAAQIEEQIRSEASGLTDVLADLLIRSGHPEAKVLLVVDQFEELLTTERETSSEIRRSVLCALRHAVGDRDRGVVMLGTMRSDFLDRFQSASELLDLRYEVISLGPMLQAQISDVIVAPAREVSLDVKPELVSALVADGSAPGALPLLAFTLRELWERYGRDGVLTLEEYRQGLGGLHEVVGRAAEDVMTSANVTPEQEKDLRAAFMAMLRSDAGGKYVRRVRRWSDLPLSVHPLLERFVEARLLASGRDDANRTIEVAHERLFTSWERLSRWIAESAESLRLREDIETAARSWSAAVGDGVDPHDYLWRGARVARARELIADGTLLLEETERRFLDASYAAERAEQANREKQRKRRFAALSVFAVVAMVLALVATIAARKAQSSDAASRAAAILADERARVADIHRARALAAQNFAEHQRVTARSQAEGLDADVQQGLLLIAPKYLQQAKRYEATAERLQTSLEEWRRSTQLAVAPPQTLFSLEVLRAESGTAFLIHYGPPASPRHLLVDGGSKKTFREVLTPRFEQLRAIHKSGSVPLDLVVASQTDAQHLDGLIALIEALERRPAPPYRVSTLWSNMFVPDDDDDYDPEMAEPGEPAPRRFVEFQRKALLVTTANQLAIPVNEPFSTLVMRPEAGAARTNWNEGLSITVLSPPVDRMREFAKFWLKKWRDRSGATYDITEDFASPLIELLPSPREVVNPPVGGARDRSIPNLASIVVMLEVGQRRMLLTADARDDLLLASLAQAGYTDDRGAMEVDILVVPHGGSETSISDEEFFRRVKARYYIFSTDGMHGNPDLPVIERLFNARRNDPKPFTIVFTYTPEEMARRRGYPEQALCRFLADERARGAPFDVLTPAANQSSIGIDLYSRAAFVPQGATTVCW